MGLFDRLKKAPGPDALTWEAVARARAVPGVAGAEPGDADTVHVTWLEHPGTTTLSLAEVRPAWAKASGFDRIELMDQVVAGLAPPPAGVASEPAPALDPVEPPAASTTPPVVEPVASPGPSDASKSPWEQVRGSISVVAVTAGSLPAAAVRWPVVQGVDAVGTSAGQPVTTGDLARWATDVDAVRAAAIERLGVEGPQLDPIGPGARAWIPTSAVAPAPAWLTAPALLLAAAGIDQAIVLAPLPTELVMVDPAATELLASILSSTTAIVEGHDDLLLAAPLLVDPAGVGPWLPAPDHPCAALVDRLRAAG